MPDSGPAATDGGSGWAGYYRTAAGRPPRRTVLTALAELRRPLEPIPARAVDLGCGGGRDTAPLLEAGLAVLALDSAPEAGAALQARFPAAWDSGQLTFRRADLTAATLTCRRPASSTPASACRSVHRTASTDSGRRSSGPSCRAACSPAISTGRTTAGRGAATA